MSCRWSVRVNKALSVQRRWKIGPIVGSKSRWPLYWCSYSHMLTLLISDAILWQILQVRMRKASTKLYCRSPFMFSEETLGEGSIFYIAFSNSRDCIHFCHRWIQSNSNLTEVRKFSDRKKKERFIFSKWRYLRAGTGVINSSSPEGIWQ